MSPRRHEPGSASPIGRAGSGPARSSRSSGSPTGTPGPNAAATAGAGPKPRRSAATATRGTTGPGAGRTGAAARRSRGVTRATASAGTRRGFASGFTGRAAILAVVVCSLLLTLAYPLRQYIGQRAQIASVEASIAEQRAQVGKLQQQLDRWNDPAYVRAQARERLHFVMPGETQYVVIGNGKGAGTPAAGATTAPDAKGTGKSGSGSATGNDQQPWYGTLWSSVQQADRS